MTDRRIAWRALVALLCSSALASADLPPPDGSKFVGYGFRVENLEAFPDFVLLAYPVARSYRQVRNGEELSVDRRDGSPQLYVMKRAEFAKFESDHPAAKKGPDPELAGLFQSKRVTVCTGLMPTPTYVLPSSDSRSSVVQLLKLEAIDAKSCKMGSGGPPVPSAPPPSPALSSSNAPPLAPSSATPARKRASACGCALPGAPAPGPALPLALGALALLFRRRESRFFG
jgi:MYXO-CTERM domain-containing protein